MVAQGDHLFDLAHLQRSRLAVVDDPAAMGFEPGHHAPRRLPREPVAPRVAAGAHAVVEDALRWQRRQIEFGIVDEPLPVGKATELELGNEGLHPHAVFVEDVDGRSCIERSGERGKGSNHGQVK